MQAVFVSCKKSGAGAYRYGFNGKEKDNDIISDDLDFGERIYDSRISRWLSIDKLQAKHPGESPYLFTGGNPILFGDPDGNDRIVKTVIVKEREDGSRIYATQLQTARADFTKIRGQDGKYYWYDTYETHVITYTAKGERIDGPTSVVVGSLRDVTDNDHSDLIMAAKLVFKGTNLEHERGGIRFTSKDGQGAGDWTINADLTSENIDVLMQAFSMASKAGPLKKPDVKDSDEWLDAIGKVTEAFGIEIPEKGEYTPSSTNCTFAPKGQHPIHPYEVDAIISDENGNAKDTIRKNSQTGNLDTIPTSPKKNK